MAGRIFQPKRISNRYPSRYWAQALPLDRDILRKTGINWLIQSIQIYRLSIIRQFAKQRDMPCHGFGTSWVAAKSAYSTPPWNTLLLSAKSSVYPPTNMFFWDEP